MVSVLDSGSSGPGSGPGRGNCVVFLDFTLQSFLKNLTHPLYIARLCCCCCCCYPGIWNISTSKN